MIHWIKIALTGLLTTIGLIAPQNISVSLQPQKPIVNKEPKNYVIFHGDRSKKLIALTFDADMTPKMKKDLQSGRVKSWYNKSIFDILRKDNVPATLFLTGMWAEIYPEETKDLSSDRLFEIGNHSYSHPGFSAPCYGLKIIPYSADQDQIEKTQKILVSLTGITPTLFRFPGGCYDIDNFNLVHQDGLDVIQWDFASNDGFNKNADAIAGRIIKKVGPGSIIVMHMMGGPNAPETAVALPKIIVGLKAEGFSFVKVSDLLNSQ